MNILATSSLYAKQVVINNSPVNILGFTPEQEKKIRQVLNGIPGHMQGHFTKIVSAPGLGAVHGRYYHDSKKIQLNPSVFNNRSQFGETQPINQFELALLHEVGHGMRFNLTDDEWQRWLQLSGWQEGGGPGQAKPYVEKRPGWAKETSTWTHSNDAQFVRLYQRKSPDEELADDFAYVFSGNADQLPPNKLNFLKQLLRRGKQ